jgi:phosphoglycolate phosphatase-like HAD superfamily hydrolase
MRLPAAVALDFDGVVAESLDVKTRAFVRVFDAFPEHAAAIEQLHLDHGGLSRFVKFEMIHRDILGIPLTDDERGRLGERFAEIVVEEVVAAPFVRGAHELLVWLAATRPVFVISGTPQEEMRSIVERRGLTPLLAGVYGSPDTKDAILRRLAGANALEPQQLLFVGDAMTDYDGALAAGVPFVARENPSAPVDFPSENLVLRVPDLFALHERWDDVVRHYAA